MARDPFKEPWYHGRISRGESEKILERSGLTEGLYLLRDSLSTTGDFVLSVCHRREIFHYQLSRRQDKIAIDSGKKFEGPVELVMYHQNNLDGLVTKLTKPCVRSMGVEPKGYRFISQAEMRKAMSAAASQLGYGPQQVQDALSFRRAAFEQLVGGILHRTQKWFHGNITREESEARIRHNMKENSFLVRERVDANSYAICLCHKQRIYHYLLERNNDGLFSIHGGRKFENLIQVVDHYSRSADGLMCALGDPCKVTAPTTFAVEPPGPKRINPSSLTVTEDLGHGSFGKVMKGIYRHPSVGTVEVALKVLKDRESPNPRHEIMKEADTMSQLDHENIVRLIGICASEPMMVVMELAELGPLNKYLRKEGPAKAPVEAITNFAVQVAIGMAYLESVRFVHRDLAARNVLVVRPDFVKISDFGMTRALGLGSEYYTAETQGKWPLKWYAPECIYFSRFDSKTDVWSFGVTMWEAYSYGSKPYHGKKGPEILQMIEANQRLERPAACPSHIFRIMLQCWNYEADSRPTFAVLADRLKEACHTRMPPPTHPRY